MSFVTYGEDETHQRLKQRLLASAIRDSSSSSRSSSHYRGRPEDRDERDSRHGSQDPEAGVGREKVVDFVAAPVEKIVLDKDRAVSARFEALLMKSSRRRRPRPEGLERDGSKFSSARSRGGKAESVARGAQGGAESDDSDFDWHGKRAQGETTGSFERSLSKARKLPRNHQKLLVGEDKPLSQALSSLVRSRRKKGTVARKGPARPRRVGAKEHLDNSKDDIEEDDIVDGEEEDPLAPMQARDPFKGLDAPEVKDETSFAGEKPSGSKYISSLVKNCVGSVKCETINEILATDGGSPTSRRRGWQLHEDVKQLRSLVADSRGSLYHHICDMAQCSGTKTPGGAGSGSLRAGLNPWAYPSLTVVVENAVPEENLMHLDVKVGVVGEPNSPLLSAAPYPGSRLVLFIPRQGWGVAMGRRGASPRRQPKRPAVTYAGCSKVLHSLGHLGGTLVTEELIGKTIKIYWPWFFSPISNCIVAPSLVKIAEDFSGDTGEGLERVCGQRDLGKAPRDVASSEPSVPCTPDPTGVDDWDLLLGSQLSNGVHLEQLDARIEGAVLRDVLLDVATGFILESSSTPSGSVSSHVLLSRRQAAGAAAAPQYCELEINCNDTSRFLGIFSDDDRGFLTLRGLHVSHFKPISRDVAKEKVLADVDWNAYLVQQGRQSMTQPFLAVLRVTDATTFEVGKRGQSWRRVLGTGSSRACRTNALCRLLHCHDNVLFVLDASLVDANPIPITVKDCNLEASIHNLCPKGCWVLLRDVFRAHDKEKIVLDAHSMVEKVHFGPSASAPATLEKGHQVASTLTLDLRGNLLEIPWYRRPDALSLCSDGLSNDIGSPPLLERMTLQTPLLERVLDVAAAGFEKAIKARLPFLSRVLAGPDSRDLKLPALVALDGNVKAIGIATKHEYQENGWGFELLRDPGSYTVGEAVALSREDNEKDIALEFRFANGTQYRVRTRYKDFRTLVGDSIQSANLALALRRIDTVKIPCVINTTDAQDAQHLTSVSLLDEDHSTLVDLSSSCV